MYLKLARAFGRSKQQPPGADDHRRNYKRFAAISTVTAFYTWTVISKAISAAKNCDRRQRQLFWERSKPRACFCTVRCRAKAVADSLFIAKTAKLIGDATP